MKHQIISAIVISIISISAWSLGGAIYDYLFGKESTPIEIDATINEIKHERDSFQLLFKQSVSREQQHILRHEADSIKVIGLEKSVAFRESRIKSYQQRLDENKLIVVQHSDSFLIKRYPYNE